MTEADAPTPEGAVATVDQMVAERTQRHAQAEPVADAPETVETETTEPEVDTTTEDPTGEAETPGDGEGEAETQEPETPAVNAPHWWTAEQKAKWTELTPEHQAIILETEQNRERVVSQAKQKASEAEKAAQKDVEGIKQLAASLGAFLPQALETFQSRWPGADQPGYWENVITQLGAEEAFKFKTRYDAEQQQLQQLNAAREQADAQAHQAFLKAEAAKLPDLAPELADPKEGPARRQKVGQFLLSLGVEETALRHISATEMSLAHDAMRWRELKAKSQAEAAKPKAPKPAPKPVAPAASAEGSPTQSRLAELEARARRTGKLDDTLAYREARRKAGIA